MTIVDLLERNAREFGEDTALVEINPDQPETRKQTWQEFELVEPTPKVPHYRREITWGVFNEKANRFANMLKQHGIGKGNRLALYSLYRSNKSTHCIIKLANRIFGTIIHTKKRCTNNRKRRNTRRKLYINSFA